VPPGERADVLGDAAHLVPVGAVGDHVPIVRGGAGVLLVAGLLDRVAEVRVPDVREPLVEEERKDELLVVAGIDQAAQDGRRAPEVALELLLRDAGVRESHPPSLITRRR